MTSDIILINESEKIERRYQCPFCTVRDTRSNLVIHVDEEHEECIPQDYTSARVIFNHINKKTQGKCIVCGKPTKWNESSWKYDRICCNKCRKIFKKEVIDKRMIAKYGKVTLLNDPEHQKKMLEGRKISGKYKFKDGGIKTYTASYEKNLLEFMDKVLNIPSTDIETPGPIYNYEFKGKTLTWITDMLYIPFNLVFDVKDGGSNKNTHPNMEEYRQKQIAKEEVIKSAKIHNYIRLTDNNFEQLLQVMADIKARMMDEENMKKETIVHINEAEIGGIHSQPVGPVVYLLPYSKNNVGVEGIGMIKDLLARNVFVHNDDNGKIEIKDKDDFKNMYYSILKIDCDKKVYKEMLEDIKNENEVWDINYFQNKLGIDSINLEDVILDESCKLIHQGYNFTDFNIDKDLYDMGLNKFHSITEDSLEHIYECSIFNSNKLNKINEILEEYPTLEIKENHNGIFIKNKLNGKRSKFYDSIDCIEEYILELLK